MIKGIGTDIVELSRLKRKDERFINRVLSDLEKEVYDQMTDETRQLTYLGGRFAAKEALSKAISHGTGNINFKDFVILNDSYGKPYLKKGPEICDDMVVHISLSHTDKYALAYVILEIT